MAPDPEWLAPATLADALALRAERGDEATVVAGGTFVGILLNSGLLAPPPAFLSLRALDELRRVWEDAEGLHLGALVTHRTVETHPAVRDGWPVLADTFALVANERVRNQATVGGVLADADYASDPPATLVALDAVAVLARGQERRRVPVAELIQGHYETVIAPDELLVEVVVPRRAHRGAYRKFRSRSSEDRPCVGVAAVVEPGADGRVAALRVVVGAVSGRPQVLPDACAVARGERLDEPLAAELGRRYAEAIDPLDDLRGSAGYRRRVIAVEVRRALLEAAAA